MSTKLQQLFPAETNTLVNPVNDWALVEIDYSRSQRVIFFSTKEDALHFFETDFVNGDNITEDILITSDENVSKPHLTYLDKERNMRHVSFSSLKLASEQLIDGCLIYLGNTSVMITNMYYIKKDNTVEFINHSGIKNPALLLSELKNKEICVENVMVSM